MNNPVILTLFGVTGDLSQKKLLPALYKLFDGHSNEQRFAVIGYGRRPWDHDVFKAFIKEALQQNIASDQDYTYFLQHCHYVSGEFDTIGGFERLHATIEGIEQSFDAP